MRGEENCKYLCADSEADMLKLIAAVVQAKVHVHGLVIMDCSVLISILFLYFVVS